MPKVTTTRKLTSSPHNLKASDLRDLLKGVDPDVQVRVDYYPADPRDQRESDQITLSVEVTDSAE